MWHDSIVEEIRRKRQVYAAKFHHDIKAICRAAREEQKKRSQNCFVATAFYHNSPESQYYQQVIAVSCDNRIVP